MSHEPVPVPQWGAGSEGGRRGTRQTMVVGRAAASHRLLSDGPASTLCSPRRAGTAPSTKLAPGTDPGPEPAHKSWRTLPFPTPAATRNTRAVSDPFDEAETGREVRGKEGDSRPGPGRTYPAGDGSAAVISPFPPSPKSATPGQAPATSSLRDLFAAGGAERAAAEPRGAGPDVCRPQTTRRRPGNGSEEAEPRTRRARRGRH